MRRAVLEVAVPADVQHRVYPNGKLGGLTVDGPLPGALGEVVEIEVRVAQPRRSFVVKGQLAWARHRGSKALKECFGADFVGGEDQGPARLLAFARHEVDPELLRAEPRMATNLPVKLVHHGETRKEFLADISSGGAFVRSGTPLDPGSKVELHLRHGLALTALKLHGHVAWVRRTGSAPGMGIQFDVSDYGAHERLLKLLAKLGSQPRS